MAVLAGATSLNGIRRWATGVDSGVLTALARGGPITVPVVSTLSRLLARLDGKCVRGAVTATSKAPYLVSVFRQDTKTVAVQRQIDVKSNEITVFETVLDVLTDLT